MAALTCVCPRAWQTCRTTLIQVQTRFLETKQQQKHFLDVRPGMTSWQLHLERKPNSCFLQRNASEELHVHHPCLCTNRLFWGPIIWRICPCCQMQCIVTRASRRYYRRLCCHSILRGKQEARNNDPLHLLVVVSTVTMVAAHTYSNGSWRTRWLLGG